MAIQRPARLEQSRHGIFVLRLVVPVAHRDADGRPREVRISLRTRDPARARVLALQLNADIDVITSAKAHLLLVSFVAYDVPSVSKALNEAVSRGVSLQVLLEASTAHGGTLSVDPAAIVRSKVPAAEIFTWKDKDQPFADGKVHAKLAVADGTRAFLTSANLTGHALDKNMEVGVLINGGSVPKALADHLQALINVRVIAIA